MRSRPMRRYAGQRGRRQRKGRPRFTPLVSGLIRAGSRKDAACSNRRPFLTFPRCGRASQGLERRRFCDETKAIRKEARSIRESRLDPHMQPHFAADTMSDSRRTDFIPSDRLPTIGTRRQTQFAKRPQESRRWRQTRSGPVGHEGLGSICPRWHYFFAALLGSLTASRVAISVL